MQSGKVDLERMEEDVILHLLTQRAMPEALYPGALESKVASRTCMSKLADCRKKATNGSTTRSA